MGYYKKNISDFSFKDPDDLLLVFFICLFLGFIFTMFIKEYNEENSCTEIVTDISQAEIRKVDVFERINYADHGLYFINSIQNKDSISDFVDALSKSFFYDCKKIESKHISTYIIDSRSGVKYNCNVYEIDSHEFKVVIQNSNDSSECTFRNDELGKNFLQNE